MVCDADSGRDVVALVTALANGEDVLYRSLVADLDDDARDCALHSALGFILGLLRHEGDPVALIAGLGPLLEARRG